MRWLSLHIGGQRWKVDVVGTKSKHVDGGELNGKCDYQACRIYIRSDLNEEARADTLLHELLHALLHVTGAEAVYGGDPTKDEQLVAALTPALHRLLKDLGFRFPKGLS